MSKEGKEESREKLIRELQDLGQLIAPDDGRSSGADPLEDPAPLLTPLADAFDDVDAQTTEVDAPEGPETVDMFVADGPSESALPATDSDVPEMAPQPHDQEQDQDPAITQTAQPAAFAPAAIETALDTPSDNPDSGGSGAYLDELVDELVGAVEKRLSLQSGESLPESLRDELSRDIKDRLAPWWSEG